MLQVLWEQGFVDDTKKVTKHYTMGGAKDRYGNVDKTTSLVAMMEQC